MVAAMNRIDVGRAAQAACVLEAISAKPGNVNRHFDFDDTTLADFLLSSVMIGHCMAEADRNSVGKTVLSAVQATRSVVACNTNLGIILLFTPLAKAYGGGDLKTALRLVLESFTSSDALYVSRAIRLASPGGLGTVQEQDVACDPDITLLELMSLARERDSVAREYATGFSIIFDLAYPALDLFVKQSSDFSSAIVQTYLSILAEVPDTLISRKKGTKAAKLVSCMAKQILRAGGTATEHGKNELEKFDAYLRSEGNSLNPGTTADLTAAAIFTYFLQHDLCAWQKPRA
jgi:triphosphoribosyl-dephospho-CoA synthase